MNKHVIVMGIQGSGKGTQSERLVADFGLTFVGSGDIFRWLISNNTNIGRRIKERMDTGKMLSDEMVFSVIGGRLDLHDWSKGILLDGFPRSESQRHWLLDVKRYPFNHVLYLDIPDESVVLERLMARKRADDTELGIKNRIADYRNKTEPTLEAYEKAGLLRKVNGLGTVDEVYARVLTALGWKPKHPATLP